MAMIDECHDQVPDVSHDAAVPLAPLYSRESSNCDQNPLLGTAAASHNVAGEDKSAVEMVPHTTAGDVESHGETSNTITRRVTKISSKILP